MSKLGKAFMSLILDKKARDALQNAAQQPMAPPPPAATPAHPPVSRPQPSVKAQLDAKLDEVQNRPERTTTPTRQQLIQDALRVRASKQDVLADLSDEQRLKLQVLAMKAMMPPKPGGQGN